jgi:hypothetical protein
MGSDCTLYVKNHATTGVTEFCVHQPAPDQQTTMAWYVVDLAAGAIAQVPCPGALDFIWVETDKFGGATVTEWQSIPASTTDPGQAQAVLDFTDGAFVIAPGTPEPHPVAGTLYVAATGHVPPGGAVVGIGRLGSPVFTVPAEPNTLTTFTMHDGLYRVAAAAPGTFTARAALPPVDDAQVIDVTFDGDVPEMTATWDGSTWLVAHGPPPVTA